MIVRVWAPAARRVECVIEGKARAMQREQRGHWTCEVEIGASYAFLLDGEGPFPDPRSRWQPRGVHEASVALRLDEFEWKDDTFTPVPLSHAVLYELHVGTFSPSGTYAGAAEKLPYLRDLGVTHIELMPLATFPGNHGWGYDGVCLYAPHPAYGPPRQLQELVQAAHDEGIAVLLDVVYNHLGPDGNHLERFGPYFTDRYRTPWGPAVNFDGPGSDEVRAFFIDNALAWLRDYHFDGLRLDAVHAILDTRAVHFLEELTARVRQLEESMGRRLVLVAESDANDPRLVWPLERGGFGLDAHWMDDFHHALHAALTGERDGYYADFGSIEQLAHALRRAYVFEGQYSGFRDRSHGRPRENVRQDQMVVFSQNHDQVGNRGFGERLSQIVDVPALKAAAALVLLGPFVPLLFQGEEWAASTPFLYFTDHQNAELARAVREGRRREFAAFDWEGRGQVPDPQAPETFAASRLRWEELATEPHAQMHAWYREMLKLRREHGAGDLVHVELDEKQSVLLLQRDRLIVAINIGEAAVAVEPPPGAWEVVCASAEDCAWQSLPRHGVLVVRGKGDGLLLS
ncbi:MAG TPA: malto-oligosyltrehalose trehalohydrolase [Candidatus Binatia bacterium]|nr:malto-oligosyltrehalose trehalohydrolase [Candidatus Binatia bacterium]